MKRAVQLMVACVAVLFASEAESHGGVIRFRFTGTTSQAPTGIFAGQGELVTGFFSYDSKLINSIPGSNQHNEFASSGPNPNSSFEWDITVTIGSVTRSTSNNAQSIGRLIIRDGYQSDQFNLDVFPSNSFDDFAWIHLRDASRTTHPDGVAAGTGNLTGVVPRSIDVSKFSISRQGFYSATDAGNGIGRLNYRIENIKAVPEPSSLAIFGIGALCTVGTRRRRKREQQQSQTSLSQNELRAVIEVS